MFTLGPNTTSDIWLCDDCMAHGRIEHGNHGPATMHVVGEGHAVTVLYQHEYKYLPLHTDPPSADR